MNIIKSKSDKKEKKQYIDQNPFEVIAGGIKTSVVDDLGKGSVHEVRDELLGTDPEDKAPAGKGDLSEGEELDLSEEKKEILEITEAGREFAREIIHAGEIANSENSKEIQVKLQEILIEIKKLSESSEELKQEVEIISIEQTAEDPGVYHLTFLEKMLAGLRDLRLSVEDSLAWFSALRSKKASRQYNTMAKKHGTSFTLSNERQIATQVG